MLQRHMEGVLRATLRHFPVVLLTGPRQVGKSTLARTLVPGSAYRTLDDRATLDAALSDPDGLLAACGRPLVLDEVQKAPDLLRAVKLVVDRDRKLGSYLLTGSADVLTLRRVSETLAGRVAVHELHPLTLSELAERPAPRGMDDLFEAKDARELLGRWPARDEGGSARVRKRILRGGFPTPALDLEDAQRETWFEGYRQTYVERDLRELSAVEQLPDFGRLMSALALRTGQILNLSSLSQDLGIPFSTLRRHVHLLLQTYQAYLLHPWAPSPVKRMARTPKVYSGDTGFACHLSAADTWEDLVRQGRVGPLMESWIASELRALRSLSSRKPGLWTWRTQNRHEVDFILERGEQVAGIEVKSGSGFGHSDLAGLRACREAMGKRWRFGVLLHAGTGSVPLDAQTVAVPYAAFLGA